MKVFISHKDIDYGIAIQVQNILKKNQVEAYLDVLDNSITGTGEKLTKHIKGKLNECSDILVVMSENTKSSWWVPFEIGMAAQKDLPTVSYLQSGIMLPDYLSYWPRLKCNADIVKYIQARNKVKNQMLNEIYQRRTIFSNVSNGLSETERFYQELKRQLV
ncbi:TIR domain-containing protein [Ruminococcus sp. AM36-18]|nr:toll/interleukin-1 receptor domain-containing protein [Ruminococcus sp. AM36-18]RGH56088.1 TIR domain-containing protein [Ruminococcus sp. AM36-18]